MRCRSCPLASGQCPGESAPVLCLHVAADRADYRGLVLRLGRGDADSSPPLRPPAPIPFARSCPYLTRPSCRCPVGRCWARLGPYLGGHETDDAGCEACLARHAPGR